MSDIIASPHYEEFYPPTYKGVEQNEFFLKTKQFTNCTKNPLQKTPTHFICNESGYIFPTNSKKLKIFALTYYGVRTQKFFLKNDEK